MIKAEIFEYRALLLDNFGQIWEVTIGLDEQPEIRLLERVPHEAIKRLMTPALAHYIPRP